MREVVVRSISGVVFVALILATLLVWRHNALPFVILFSIVTALTTYEYLTLTIGREKKKRVIKILGTAASLFTFLIAAFSYSVELGESCALLGFGALLLVGLAAIIFLLPIVNLFTGKNEGVEFAWSSILYIGVPFACLNLLSKLAFAAEPASHYFDGWVIASLMIIIWAGDVGAYCIGTAFGQGTNGHKLMPSVSPKKSWEGVFGAIAFAIITAVILRACGVLMEERSYIFPIAFAVVISAASILGDLIESQLKRRFNVKDSGAIMPGHGGFLDRFDSCLTAFPAATLFYFILLTITR